MKKPLALSLAFLFSFFAFSVPIFAENDGLVTAEPVVTSTVAFDFDCEACILTEATLGTVLYESGADKALAPASVTKVLTLLVVMEAIADGSVSPEDNVTVSEYAASMGGSQVFLEAGEVMTVEELVKCTVIASANDAAVALAETVAGTEEAFVAKMNARAGELGLTATHFENVTGLDDTVTNHVTSARDVAEISRRLIGYDLIRKYAGLWQDSTRDGEFTLTNTNRLVRYYDGCTGLKTGSTDKAGYCVTVTAQRGDLSLVAVIMGAKSRDSRNAAAKSLLDYGFSSFALYTDPAGKIEDCPARRGKVPTVGLVHDAFRVVVPKSQVGKVERTYELPEVLTAPFSETVPVGKIVYTLGEETLGECEILPDTTVPELGFAGYYALFLRTALFGDPYNGKDRQKES